MESISQSIPTKPHIPDFRLKRHQGYLGNVNLKKAGVKLNLTPEHEAEFKRCANDIVYFCENYMKIISVDHGLVPFVPWDFQKEMLQASQENRFNLVCTARQMGKCLAVNSLITVRNKLTGVIYECKIDEFHQWQLFRKYYKDHISQIDPV
ncbi:MAG TPA: hypothetical protein VIJ14_10085 [Rhabdochlamydiaceae bacterium]